MRGTATPPSALLSPLNLLTPLDDPAPIMTQRTYIQEKPRPSGWRPRAVSGGRPPHVHARSGPFCRCEEHEEERDAASDPIAYKRRRNTLAARRTRQRKVDYLQALEEKVKALSAEVTTWRERALLAQELLRGRGIDFNFDDKELAGHIK
ncbi:hypothetical protein B0H12DRAFT_534110 [Mycena haematopus]|nr:hypothetical protein B0H12DRAFT_534110 [Mycena haematopus]